MATTATQITMEAYLNSIFHPDMEYVDGELKARTVPAGGTSGPLTSS